MSKTPLIIIPARFASKRLPGKPLEKIGNKTLIEHAIRSAWQAKGAERRILVATDNEQIAGTVDIIGNKRPIPRGKLVHWRMTDEDLETGTDRCAQAIENSMGWDDCPDWVINVQGDMPFGTAPFIDRVIAATQAEPQYDMITPACLFETVEWEDDGDGFKRTLLMQHVGIYAYRKEALKEFYEARDKPEIRETETKHSLEQNRAVEIGLSIKILYVHDMLPPLEVNTPADLKRLQEIANAGISN